MKNLQLKPVLVESAIGETIQEIQQMIDAFNRLPPLSTLAHVSIKFDGATLQNAQVNPLAADFEVEATLTYGEQSWKGESQLTLNLQLREDHGDCYVEIFPSEKDRRRYFEFFGPSRFVADVTLSEEPSEWTQYIPGKD